MKAAQRFDYSDGVNGIIINAIEKPKPGPNEVLIKVMATTVNRTDEGVLLGKPKIFRLFIGIFSPKNKTLGTDFAGIIEEIGEEVKNYKIGERVWGFYDESCPSQAEYLCLKKNGNIAQIPMGWTYSNIVACAEGLHYARNFINKVQLIHGQKAMVYGATGAIGSALVQMLKYHKLEVTAVCGTQNIATVKAMGPSKVVDYQKIDFTEDDIKYDYIFDAVGKSSFGVCKKLLKERGVYISSELGPGNENLYLPITTLFSKKRVIFPFPSNIKASLTYALELISANSFQPLVEKIYPFTQVKEAYSHMLSQQKVGNIILKISDED